ncbi:MAG: undecaprenyl/decaprenyl-phosphate alpha-N-acetylglucosaminyl 1-phosphate transferase [Sphingobacteriia bacterium]|nr:MAG: undecaprenyl/decaprenyl-phosphate alpha-N-acetylglucosaminyl 1-phosphate transferase [Sphingobacteriia bacterium]TAH06589.1 MAG: undecaprenyl/decaprenyl-phosphate alpha-N-acetylglucosaminyl 1-phosphate transferase [Sphingobacteriia bacterium]
MENILLGSIFAFVITFYAIPVIIQVSNMKKLFDIPSERKIHEDPIPSLGGLGIFAGFMVGLLLMADLTNAEAAATFQYYLTACMVIFFFGIKDDILILTPFKKFLGQLAVAIILIFKANLVITSMHGFLGIGMIDYTMGCCLSFFTIIVVINAFNLIDGVDGLAGSMGIVTSSFFAFFGLMSGEYYYALIGFTFAASLGAFLIYNYTPARIFMGDTGAMLIGVVNAILVIHFINMAENTKILPVLASPAMGFGVLLLPLLDTLRVFAIRILHGRSPFSPDRNHLHHLLLDRGLSHMSITVILSAFAILIIFITYFLLPIGTTKVILLQLVGFFGVVGFLQYGKPRKSKKLKVIKGNKLDESGAGIKAAYRNLGVFGNGDALNIDKE